MSVANIGAVTTYENKLAAIATDFTEVRNLRCHVRDGAFSASFPADRLPPVQALEVAIAVVIHEGKVLICQRRPDVPLGGFWEFPGGKREPGETLEGCAVREVSEELGIVVRTVDPLTPIDHLYPHARVRLHPFICAYESGEVQHLGCQATEWVDPPALRAIRFPPANELLIEEILSYMRVLPADGPNRPSPEG